VRNPVNGPLVGFAAIIREKTSFWLLGSGLAMALQAAPAPL
jgi:hypothetical protein